jgi:hypothetical protein
MHMEENALHIGLSFVCFEAILEGCSKGGGDMWHLIHLASLFYCLCGHLESPIDVLF